jgi:hypothetical protein
MCMKKTFVLFWALLFVSTFPSAQKIETVNGVSIIHNEKSK